MDASLRFVFSWENVLVTTAAVVAYFLLKSLLDVKRRRLPPGPAGLPFIGYIPLFPSDYAAKLLQLFKHYGSVFSMRLGTTDVVFVSDYQILKAIGNMDVFQGRPQFPLFSIVTPTLFLCKCLCV